MKSPMVLSIYISMLATAILLWTVPTTKAFASYDCQITTVGNCHAVVNVTNMQHWDGGTTTYYLTHLLAGDGHANTELWLVADVPPGYSCPQYGFDRPACWIEVGSKNGPNQCSSGQCYFWDDLRPCINCSGGNNYYQHNIGNPKSTDYGQQVTSTIDRKDSTDFTVSVGVSGQSNPTTGLSVSNVMQPIVIEIGAEVQGTTGAQVPQTDFIYNAGRSTINSNYYYFTQDGQDVVIPPFKGQWARRPSLYFNGGAWRVSFG